MLKRFLNKLKRVFSAGADTAKLPPMQPEERAAVDLLRKNLETLKGTMVSAADFWSTKRTQLIDKILTSDPREFTRWEVMYPMFYEADPLELEWLRSLPEWKDIEPALKEDNIGMPRPYNGFTASSGNLIHHAYSLFKFLKANNLVIANLKSIFEFGGGYGSFCRLCYKLGFKGEYLIFDLPEYTIFQQYYLSSLKLNLKVVLNKVVRAENTVSLISDLEQIPSQNYDTFFALWSISETPFELRDNFFKRVSFSNVFIAYQNDFYGTNNKDYFSVLENRMPEMAWKTLPISHIKGNNYLIGKIK
jgi:hypothetical protein